MNSSQQHLLFVWNTSGYQLVEQEGAPPAVGDEVEIGEELFRVAKLAPSPLPRDERQCAYLGR